jgi:hypothetical protein
MPSAQLKSIDTDCLTNVVKVRGFSAFFHMELATRWFQVNGIRIEGDEI